MLGFQSDSQIERSLSLKLILWASGAALLFTCGLTTMDFRDQRHQEIVRMRGLINEVARSHASVLQGALQDDDEAVIQNELQGLASIRDIDRVALTTRQGRVFSAGASDPSVRFDQEVQLVDPAQPGETLARLKFSSSLRAADQATTSMLLRSFLQEFAVCTLVLGLLVVYLHLTFVRPLMQITHYLSRFRPEGDVPPVAITRFGLRGSYDELDALTDHINALKDRVLMSHWALKEANAHLEKRVEERTATILDQRHKLEASARWSALGEMAGSIAHEINNPLAIIMGKAQILLRREDSTQNKASLEQIIKTTERIAGIIKSLRVLSRDASADSFEFVPATQILKDAMGISEERLRNLGIELRLQDSIADWEIFCRRVQVSQILVNLINNSIDAIEHQQGEKWVAIDLRIAKDHLLFRLIDSGPGIPEAIRSKIMTPFFTTKEVGKGTGMGLSQSRSIMAAHHGSLEIDFQAPHTTMQLSFPEFRPCESEPKKVG